MAKHQIPSWNNWRFSFVFASHWSENVHVYPYVQISECMRRVCQRREISDCAVKVQFSTWDQKISPPYNLLLPSFLSLFLHKYWSEVAQIQIQIKHKSSFFTNTGQRWPRLSRNLPLFFIRPHLHRLVEPCSNFRNKTYKSWVGVDRTIPCCQNGGSDRN